MQAILCMQVLGQVNLCFMLSEYIGMNKHFTQTYSLLSYNIQVYMAVIIIIIFIFIFFSVQHVMSLTISTVLFLIGVICYSSKNCVGAPYEHSKRRRNMTLPASHCSSDTKVSMAWQHCTYVGLNIFYSKKQLGIRAKPCINPSCTHVDAFHRLLPPGPLTRSFCLCVVTLGLFMKLKNIKTLPQLLVVTQVIAQVSRNWVFCI